MTPPLQESRAGGGTTLRRADRRPSPESGGRRPAPRVGLRSSLQAVDKLRRDVKSLVEDLQQSVTLAFEDFEPRVRHHLHPLLQQIDLGEWIAVAAHEKGRAAN